ncbi:hypothetical protein CTI12_AA185960 [Artemisia annua]|uniref:Uncharacterized protein n=1 Tax=Artemisia annua TaxID=35608 RepID=A0A2U1P6Z5_ARTAN|nr:hypothetical protein CTI12_AA185960 [Artemisia annua]
MDHETSRIPRKKREDIKQKASVSFSNMPKKTGKRLKGSTFNYQLPTTAKPVKQRMPKKSHKRIGFTSREHQIDDTTVMSLIAMLNQSSAVAKAFRMARDWCASHAMPNLQLRLLSNRTSSRQYNTPSVSEVAALITNDFGQGIPARDIIVSYYNYPFYIRTFFKEKNKIMWWIWVLVMADLVLVMADLSGDGGYVLVMADLDVWGVDDVVDLGFGCRD